MKKIKYFLALIGLGCLFTIGCDAKVNKSEIAKAINNMKTSVVVLPDKDSKFTVKVGEKLEYTGKIHPSVGIGYTVDYDKQAFNMTYQTRYNNPGAMEEGMSGGDSGSTTCVFTALKKGTYKIKVLHDFRGTTEKTVTFLIKVK